MLTQPVPHSPTVDSQLYIAGRAEADAQFVSHRRALALQGSMTMLEQVR